MGGHALSPGLTTRKSSSEYFRIKSQVLELLSSPLSSDPSLSTLSPPPPSQPLSSLITFSDLPEPPNKESFGDLDLIYYRDPSFTPLDLRQFLTQLFHPTEMIQSGNVLSFDYQTFQIDFIECTKETFPMMKFCLSYGDRGMILGQIARWWGFSLSFNGLLIISEDLETLCGVKGVTEKIILSLDPADIRLFMNLPPTDEMIQSLDDIGLFCKSSSWYRPEIFTRKLNAEGRKRWAKRPYYRFFIEQVVQETRHHYQFYREQLASLPSSSAAAAAAVTSSPPSSSSPPRHSLASFPVNTHLYHHIHPSLLSLTPRDSPNPFLPSESPHFELYSHTPEEVYREQRFQRIQSALTYFDKWDEVKAIREKYLELQQRREKFNCHILVQLGIPSQDLIVARNQFIDWLIEQQCRGEEMLQGVERRGESDRCEYEELALKNETPESVQQKLLLWYQQRSEKA